MRLKLDADFADPLRGINQINLVVSQGIEGLGASDNGSLDHCRAPTAGLDFTKVEATLSRLQPLGPRLLGCWWPPTASGLGPLSYRRNSAAMAAGSSAAPTTPRSWSATSCILAAGGAALRHPPDPAQNVTQFQLYGFADGAGFIILPQFLGHLRTWMALRLEGDFASVLQPGLTADLSAAKGVAGIRDDWRFFFIMTGRF